jgi:hypothetical protein
MPEETDFRKEVEKTSAILERLFALRLLWALQCIKCGMIIDNHKNAIQHSLHCKVKVKEE